MKFKYDPNTMKREYVFVVNHKKIEDKLIKTGFDNIVLLKNEMPEEAELTEIQNMGYRSACYVTYFDSKEKPEQFKKMVNKTVHVSWPRFYNNYMEAQGCELVIKGNKAELDECGEIDLSKYELSIDEFCELFDQLFVKLDLWEDSAGYILHTDYANRCGNCHMTLGESDVYCQNCGTKRGKGEFSPYTNEVDFLYGYPDIVKRKCPKCGKIWYVPRYGMDDKSFCTQCGLNGEVIKSKYTFTFGEIPDLGNGDAVDKWLDDNDQ